MAKIYRYLLGDFFRTLFTYFGILFFLVSIMYFVRISGYTSVMSMTFADIFTIYAYYVPQIIIYTFPLTYFIALSVSLYNFSKDGEMLVLFSLGKSPFSVVMVYLGLSFFISLFLIVNSLVLMPLSEQASHNFLKIKKVESKINVKSSEVGQKVANWHIFTKKSKEYFYNDLVLFSKNYKNKEQFILSKNAKFDSYGDSVSLILNDGNHYMIDEDSVILTNFKTLKLTNALYKDELENKSIVEYWKEAKNNKYRARWLSIYMLLSMFVFFGVFYAFSIGIINPRIQKRYISFWIALVVLVYYGFAFKLAEISPLKGEMVFAIVFFVIGFLVFKKTILKRY